MFSFLLITHTEEVLCCKSDARVVKIKIKGFVVKDNSIPMLPKLPNSKKE